MMMQVVSPWKQISNIYKLCSNFLGYCMFLASLSEQALSSSFGEEDFQSYCKHKQNFCIFPFVKFCQNVCIRMPF